MTRKTALLSPIKAILPKQKDIVDPPNTQKQTQRNGQNEEPKKSMPQRKKETNKKLKKQTSTK